MAGREPLFFPFDQSPGQMFATWACALSAAAYDVGEVIADRMTRMLGQNWKSDIREDRRRAGDAPKFNAHDPQWIFSEPNRHGSPVALRMPPGYSDRFRKVNWKRNDWFHKNTPWSLSVLLADIQDLRSALVIFNPSLRAKDEIDALSQHLEVLRQRRILPSPREAQLEGLARQAQTQLAEANERAARLQAELDEVLMRQLENDEVAQRLQSQLQQEKARAARAKEEAEVLEQLLSEAEASRDINPDDLLPTDLRPGDPWPQEIPLGGRKIKLLRPPNAGLWDPEARRFLTAELGGAAREAALRWGKVMPLGADIHVTRAWNAAGRVGADLVYLGRVDEPGEQERAVGAELADFLTSRTYMLQQQGLTDGASGQLLSAANPARGVDTTERVREAVALAKAQGLFSIEELQADEGSVELRITTTGHLAAYFSESPGYLTTVTASEWFPGHLRD